MKKERMLLILLTLLITLSACGNFSSDVSAESAAVPARMVSRLDVSIHPSDDSMARSYTDMEKMSPILRFLRDMDTTHKPEEEPNLTDGQTYYTITAVYANGESRIYYLLSHQYMRIDDGQWCEIDNQDAMELIQYIRNTPDTIEETEPEASETQQEVLPQETSGTDASLPEETTPSVETENPEESTVSA